MARREKQSMLLASPCAVLFCSTCRDGWEDHVLCLAACIIEASVRRVGEKLFSCTFNTPLLASANRSKQSSSGAGLGGGFRAPGLGRTLKLMCLFSSSVSRARVLQVAERCLCRKTSFLQTHFWSPCKHQHPFECQVPFTRAAGPVQSAAVL